ncbi:MAG: DUF1722 domain-containing protein [Gammaproteobacteria bacterium]|nr:MAG: DUF1722 domain-containing protein [Gammaproteobacteria bacterium]
MSKIHLVFDHCGAATMQPPRPRVAVSACILGQPVRYDGGHKRDRFVTDRLARELEFVPVCPELEAGLGVPRSPIHLRRRNGEIRLVGSRDHSLDLTGRMREVAARRADEFDGRICGLIVQRNSPSCGMERVAVANEDGTAAGRTGTGMFVHHFRTRCPLVPIEEAGRLNDPVLRENFLERVWCLHRWYRLGADDLAGFIRFHAAHKLLLMARGSDAYTGLGRIVSGVTRETLAERRGRYIRRFMEVLSKRVSRAQHYNVLQHILGHFRRRLAPADRRELLDLFGSYRSAEVPLAAPLTLLRHHLRRNPDPWLDQQYYFRPYPDALALRAAV